MGWWTWQCNVFGHYILCRALEASSRRRGRDPVASCGCPRPRHVRILTTPTIGNSWIPHAIRRSKFQMDLIRAELSRRAGPSAPIRHFTVHPGAVDSSISAALESGITTYLKIFTFYLARWLGCLNFNISPWNGAAAAVYVCLAQLAFIPVFLSAAGVPVTRGKEEQNDGASRYACML
ncbi:hypothetical protein BJV77DRAFT_529034 [Russula vinacea]|nr:hypothetical protein BJV77DRAFT_529034 [Russula vinacea]